MWGPSSRSRGNWDDKLERPERAKMRGQFRRLNFNQIRFHVLDDPIARRPRQQIDNRPVNLGRRGKGPTFFAAAVDNLDDLIGELPVNSAIGFRFQLRPFRDRIGMASTSPIAHWKSTSEVGHLVDKFPVRIREVECLNETQARTARWCFIHPVCFQTAAIRHDDEGSRCHKRITDKCCPRRKSCASRFL